MTTVHIGLPKGRGLEYTRRACSRMDIKLRPGLFRYEKAIGRRRLVVHILKFGDIAHLIATAALDLGVTGDEWLLETAVVRERETIPTLKGSTTSMVVDADGSRLADIPIYTARLCLLLPEAATSSGTMTLVASPYPNLARRLTTELDPRPQILPIQGTSEALVPDLADAAIDVVETGTTVRLHRLAVAVDYGVIRTCLARSRVFDVKEAWDLIADLREPLIVGAS